MKQVILMICLCISIVGCKNNDKNKEAESKTEIEQEVTKRDKNQTPLEIGCYVYKGNGDLVKFEITEINNNNVKGILNYAYAEKDKNDGTFEGVLNGDKLFGTYTFMSEGVQSTRDLAFKIEKKQIVEGFGDLNEDGTTFKDTTAINYNSTTPWPKGPCD